MAQGLPLRERLAVELQFNVRIRDVRLADINFFFLRHRERLPKKERRPSIFERLGRRGPATALTSSPSLAGLTALWCLPPRRRLAHHGGGDDGDGDDRSDVASHVQRPRNRTGRRF